MDRCRVAQRFEGLAFADVVLAAVLAKVVDGVTVAVHERAQRLSPADRAQLPVVASKHQFGPGHFCVN